jgi:dolichyl-phosphate-mannose--protein O-mannosyl transferase
MYYGKDDGRSDNKFLPIILLVVSAAAIVATVIFWFYGIYFFFFFLPLTFSLPWSVKRLLRRKTKKQWNVEDLR